MHPTSSARDATECRYFFKDSIGGSRMGIDFATAKRWVFTRRRYFHGNAVYFGERFGDDEDRIRSNRERGIRSLLLRRAGGSGVAARLIVEDTTSLQSAGWRKRGVNRWRSLRLALSWFSGTYRSSERGEPRDGSRVGGRGRGERERVREIERV